MAEIRNSGTGGGTGRHGPERFASTTGGTFENRAPELRERRAG